MTVQAIQNGQNNDRKNNQWSINKVAANKNNGTKAKEAVSYQTLMQQAMMVYQR